MPQPHAALVVALNFETETGCALFAIRSPRCRCYSFAPPLFVGIFIHPVAIYWSIYSPRRYLLVYFYSPRRYLFTPSPFASHENFDSLLFALTGELMPRGVMCDGGGDEGGGGGTESSLALRMNGGVEGGGGTESSLIALPSGVLPGVPGPAYPSVTMAEGRPVTRSFDSGIVIDEVAALSQLLDGALGEQ